MGREIRHCDPDRYYMCTNRTYEGQFFFRPDDECNRIARACLARAADTHNVDLVCFVIMSNHFHLVARFPERNRADFMEHFEGQLAKRVLKHRGRSSGVVFPQRFHPEALLDDQSVREMIAYVVNNPVKDFIVHRAEQWPGVTSQTCHLDDNVLDGRWFDKTKWHNIKRRKGEQSREQAMVEHTVELHVPECFEGDSREARLASMLEWIEDDRERLRKDRSAEKSKTLGPGHVLEKSWRYKGTFVEETLPRRLCVSTVDGVASEYRERRKEISAQYRHAVAAWREGEKGLFPTGTIPPGWKTCLDRPVLIPPRDTD